MGIFKKIFGGGSQKTTQSLPGYVTAPAQQASKMARNYADAGYQEYGGDTVANFTPDQLAAFDTIRGLSDTDVSGAFDTAGGLVEQGASAPAQSYDNSLLFEDITGASGETFSFADYQNPYVNEVVAQTLQALDRDREIRDLEINAAATRDGGYGDARHGVMESENFRNSQDIKGQAAARLYDQAFRTAADLKNTDATRNLQTHQTNASSAEAAANRNIAGGRALADMSQDEINQILQIATAQDASGAAQQNQEQRELDDLYRRFLERTNFDKDTASFLASIAGGLPAPVTTETKTKSNPLSMIAQLAGTAAKAYTGMPG